MYNYYLYLLAGLVGVTIMILWGIYGDLLIEEFSILKVVRSYFFGILWSGFLYLTDKEIPPFIIALVVIAFERYSTEVYKALIRDERQIKYKIPSDLNINFPRRAEKFIGYVLVVGIAVLFYYVNFSVNIIVLVLIAMLLPALGGMAKDAPYEGFFIFKFFRSPLIIAVLAFFITKFYSDLNDKYLIMAWLGGGKDYK